MDNPEITNNIPLDYPITVDGTEIRELSMRRGTVGDQLAAQRGGESPGEQEVLLFSRLTGLPAPDVEKMDLKDYGKLQERFRDFLS